MARTDPIGIRLEAEIKTALARAAKAERRSLSAMVNIALEDWLQQKGWLKEAKKGKRTPKES
jgi:hypothetical protein